MVNAERSVLCDCVYAAFICNNDHCYYSGLNTESRARDIPSTKSREHVKGEPNKNIAYAYRYTASTFIDNKMVVYILEQTGMDFGKWDSAFIKQWILSVSG